VYKLHDTLIAFLKTLENINSKHSLVSKDDVMEQYQNVMDLKDVIADFEIVLGSLKNNDLKNLSELEMDLFEVHRLLTTMEWHFSELSELNKKIIKSIK
jgi:hypothetical protein